VKPIRAGIFRTVHKAEDAVKRLLEAGFPREQISVLCSDESKERHFRQFEHEEPAGAHAGDAAATGSAAGFLLGGLTTAGLSTATGLSLLMLGPSFLIGGAVAGGLIGAMVTRGEERALADFYDQGLSRGDILVAVEDRRAGNAERLKQAEAAFRLAGAEPVALDEQ
jgi:hypothetical protein